ncbi:hypothetical protein C7999DRAFT_10069 [Corynascus novoguineensis]|uniref:Uncharacterized protein n=1 Tax=Corynascus novoguineensis TaxID=1126955 RepID=A0AAN7D279_9PEZI|nr:hypothetical protein C7999DRAFT_10069 [Corynascus novoguineensis]
MEKAHNWKYVKSKSKGKRSAAQQKADDSAYRLQSCAVAVEAGHSSPAVPASHRSMTAAPSGGDFVLFDDQEDAVGDDDDPLCLQYDDTDAAESYLPWTSPMTRLRDNELLIERFSQTYNNMQGTANTMPSTGDGGMDPVLPDATLRVFQHYHQGDTLGADAVAIKVESPVMSLDPALPMKRKFKLFEAPIQQRGQAPTSTPSTRSNRGRKQGTGQGAPLPSRSRFPSKRGDGSGGDESSPKKMKLDPTEDFTDTTMPDIFRHAHPDMYDRNRSDKYSPCHTVHREISTLVRHLSRPAHRLQVTDRVISSFDIEDPEYQHPRAGVCRNCWQTFYDRSDFDSHLFFPCQRVSKGKREKWRVLFESFTPLPASTNTALPSAQPTQQTQEQWGQLSEHLGDTLIPDGDVDLEAARTPSTSVPSPTTLQLADPTPVGSVVGRFVSADEHDRLQREHEALRERHRQLERMTQALLIKQLVQENMKITTASGREIKPPSLAASKKGPSATSPAVSDRDSLLQHMNSQSTDVDVHAFMEEMEDTRQSLSRMNSGLSTASRSTIHRVPPSPPSRRAELPASNSGNGEMSQQVKGAVAHQSPPPSIPDSGYGTENRRSSLGDLTAGAGQQSMPRPLTPPCTAESAGENNKSGRGDGDIPWGGENPSQQTPRAHTSSTLSPQHHSQPGFMMEQDMAEYNDDSFNIFYEDNIPPTRSSPPGFTFEFSSQAE